MRPFSSFVSRFASLKVTCVLLVAFLVLLFWGVLGQAAAMGEAAAAVTTERFFDSFFLWGLGIIPLPAMKSLAVAAVLHLVCSLIYRMPKNLGLWGMHIAFILLLAGGVAESEIKREYSGFSVPNDQPIYFAVGDSLHVNRVHIPEEYPYFTFYKGEINMGGTPVEIYSATYDPLKFVPYAFSILFSFSAIFYYLVRVRKQSRKKRRNGTSQVSQRNVVKKIVILALAMPCLFCTPSANATEVISCPDSLPCYGVDPVQVGSEVRPFDSFARGVLNDFYGKVSFKDCEKKKEEKRCKNLSAVDVIRNIQLDFHDVEKYNIFKILRSDVLKALNLPDDKRYVSYWELNFARSQLEIYASRRDNHPATAEMKRLLSNVELYEKIRYGKFTKAVSGRCFSLEVAYNRMNFALLAFVLSFIGCIFASVNTVFRRRWIDVTANVTCGVTMAVLATALILRLVITGKPPLSSLYEIVLLVALLLESFEFGAFLFCKKRTFDLIIPVSLMSTVLLLFAKFILEPGDLFQPIPAVLNSSAFLTLHVFAIALGYVGVILSGVVSHLVLFKPTETREKLLYGTLVFGTLFTVLGTLLGGIWADFAWGRFWGFDPKECGALFVILWTMLALHLRGGRLVNSRGFALFNSFNIIVTFLCWFGINLLGVGLHSYGFQDGTFLWLVSFIILDVLIVFGLFFWRAQKH